MACISFNIWPGGRAISVSITPQGRRKINTRREGGDRQRVWSEGLQTKWTKGNENAKLRDQLYALWPQDRIQEMKMKKK